MADRQEDLLTSCLKTFTINTNKYLLISFYGKSFQTYNFNKSCLSEIL